MKSELIKEEWKPVDGFEGLYEVSNFGRIKSLLSHKILKERYIWSGYYTVSLRKNGKTFYKLIHRLVAEAFIPNPDNLPIINHRNEFKKDNSVWNIEWCTYKYNLSYNGVRDRMAEKRGTKVRIIKGNFSMDFRSMNKAAEYIGCPVSMVWDVVNGGRIHRRNGKEAFVKHLTVKGYQVKKVS